MNESQLYMVFDVESIGLHGEGFAVGYVVIQGGKEVDGGLLTSHPNAADGDPGDREWVMERVWPSLREKKLLGWPRGVRSKFWKTWLEWRKRGAVLVADCLWPVEANFLSACVKDGGGKWDGPYPLIDVASVRLAAGLDPLGIEARLADELPEHNPLADARQSARLFREALSRPNP